MSEARVGEIAGKPEDRRVARTRAAIRSAFNALILSRGYEAISAADIAEAANVGRSTFYEHYQSKEDALAMSLAVVLQPLADACSAEAPQGPIAAAITHFWDNRQLAKVLMSGRPRWIMARQLAGLIEQRLCADPSTKATAQAALPIPLLAAQLADGQLALIEAWLSGRHGCSAPQIAAALHATSSAVVRAAVQSEGQGASGA